MNPNLRTHDEPLPRSFDEVMAYLKKVLKLPGVQKVTVTPAQISVMREVREDELVVPPEIISEPQVDIRDLLKTIKAEQHPFDPNEHPYLSLVAATRFLTDKNLFVTHIVALEGEWLSAWLGLDVVPPDQSRVLGMKVMYSSSDLLDGKVLLLGSSSSAGLLVDATHAVAIDMNLQ